MPSIDRRSFLGAAGAVGVAAAVPGVASAQPRTGPRSPRIPTTREDHRVVVVGSGFGGGVTALRLAQAGVDVLVLERGRRWPTGPNADTFATPTNPDKRMLWYQSAPTLFGKPFVVDPYVGLVEAVGGENMTALCAAGVGGGSLVYQGMTLQPSKAVFEANFPEGLDYDRLARVHYPRVAKMLQIEVAPDELIRTPNYLAPRVFAKRVRQAGLPVQKIPMPIDWSFALDEIRGKAKPSYTDGSGALGVNNGGKHTVDVTYVAQAEATGRVTVKTQHQVTDVARAKDGRWTVHVNRIDTAGRVLEHKILTTTSLVMAAGTMNTTKLLMRASATGGITDLPDGLGRGWGSNADRIYLWTSPTDDFGPVQGGPVVFGSLNWRDPKSAHTIIQASIPTLGADLHSTVVVGYGVSDARGRFVYDSATDDATLRWPREGDHSIQNRHIGPAMRKIVGPNGILLDTNLAFPSTWHPLGGANMGVVCDLDGRVKGQKGLYVLDGALMPGNSAACNPSMTIAAVAERALDNIVATDVGTII